MYSNCIHLMGLRALQGTGCQQVVNPAAASTHTLFSERKWLVIHLSAALFCCVPAPYHLLVCLPTAWHQRSAKREGTRCGGWRGAGEKRDNAGIDPSKG